MGMMLQSLVPGMEHAEEADLRAEVTRITSDLQQSCSTGVKQQFVDHPLILQCERSQFPWQGEDNVHVAGRQQLSFPRLEPAQAGVALTPWGNVGYGTSYTRWQYVRSPSTDRDVPPARRYGSV